MARLSAYGPWLIQQQDGLVMLFHEYTDEHVVRFDPRDGSAAAQAQKVIHDHKALTDEEKCFAHFWSGYFYAHAQ